MRWWNCDLPDEPALLPLLVAYFPHPLRTLMRDYIERHRLRRDLMATIVANAVGQPARRGRRSRG